MPSVVFSSPEVAIVGITEDAAVDQHKNVQIFKSEFTCVRPAPPLPKAAVVTACLSNDTAYGLDQDLPGQCAGR